MAVISITITESTAQILAGIPKSVIISTNILSTIFYTLDGTEPDLSSDIYISTLYLPTKYPTVELKVFATNGVDFSPIISETYQTNMLQNARLSHSSTDVAAGTNLPDLYPYGTNPIQPQGLYLNPGDAGITVDNPDLTQIATGYDGDGYETGFTNKSYDLENYDIIYSTRNAKGEGPGREIGNLPASIDVITPDPIPEETEQFTSLFDPRAFVIFQDFSTDNPEDPPQINREFFSLENFETARDGANYFTTGLDSPPVMGSFIRSFHNPRDNTITYYYRDSVANRWIISKTPYNPSGGFNGNLAGMALSTRPGAGFVYQWLPFTRRVLF